MIVHKWRLSWRNEEEKKEAEFWFPKGYNPEVSMKTLLNLVELDAHDALCKYKLENLGEVSID
ncbi:MAG: hypothetical protein ACFFEV_08980 [Candidatus Thorarchaeota archaeon]